MQRLKGNKHSKNLDSGRSLESIILFPKQCKKAWQDVKLLYIPPSYRGFTSIVFCGMGGSAYGARIIKSLFSDTISVPIDLVSSYNLPGYVDEKTLVILASYSGNTEETISCLHQALERKLFVVGISSGGELAEIFKKNNLPAYIFNAVYNPSRQPRIGQGYMLMGQLGILHKLGFINIPDNQIQDAIVSLNNQQSKLLNNDEQKNEAKKIALSIQDKIPLLIAAEFLEGAVHAIRNPFHETGKHFADYFIVPELNHHLVEGLKFPASNKQVLAFLLIQSSLYSQKIQKRMKLTKEVIEKNGIETIDIKLSSSSQLCQICELMQLGSFLSFYLAMLHRVDPAYIPWVDYFKEKLKR